MAVYPHQHQHRMATVPPHGDPFPSPPFSPFYGRRHTPYPGQQPEYRIFELNKRLQQRTEQDSDNLWWDAFATEFFEDDATITLTFCLEDGPKRYMLGRTLIPRYFRSIFEGGVSDFYVHLRNPKESFHNTTINLDCESCTLISHHGKSAKGMYPPGADPMKDPMNKDLNNSVMVTTEGRLMLEFTFDDLMRIKSWHFATRHHQELIPRSLFAMHAQPDNPIMDQISKNITRQGLTNSTLNYLRLCVILEPMQELMSRHKAYALSPRDCLKTTLFQKWQRMVAPPDSQRPPNKRRKRKASNNAPGAGPGSGNKKKNQSSISPGPPNFTLASQDVMVVGEPSLMGGEFGDEDERMITRLENNQFDPSSGGPPNGMDDPGMEYGMNGGGPNGPMPPGGPPSQNQGGPGGPWGGPSGGGGPPNGPSISQGGPGGGPPPQSDARPGLNGSGNTTPGIQDDSKKQSPNMG